MSLEKFIDAKFYFNLVVHTPTNQIMQFTRKNMQINQHILHGPPVFRLLITTLSFETLYITVVATGTTMSVTK